MQLVVRTRLGDADIAITPSDADLTLGEIVERAIGTRPDAQIRVDGRPVSHTTALASSGVLVGSVVDVTDGEAAIVAPLELVQVAGRGSGHRAVLAPGAVVVGPSEDPDATPLTEAPVARATVRLDVDERLRATVRLERGAEGGGATLDGTPLTSTPLPWDGGLLHVAGRVFALRRDDQDRSSRQRRSTIAIDGTLAFNRPPRPAEPPAPDPLVVPPGGGTVRDARRFPLIAMLAPLPIAVGMALLLGSPRFLLFGLMSPVMAGASWISERRQRRRDLGEARTADDDATVEFRAEAEARHRADRHRRVEGDLHMGDVADRTTNLSPLLWQRRPDHPDGFHVTIGFGALDWRPELERDTSSLSTADSIIDEIGPMAPVPIDVDLGTERGLGFIGERQAAASTARGVILHACTAHGPADLDLLVFTSPNRASAWEWTKWLPHARTGGSAAILHDRDTIAAWASSVSAEWERPNRPSRPGHLTIVVVDEPEWWSGRSSPLRQLFSEPSMPIRYLVLADDADVLPAVCTCLVSSHDDGTATVEYLLDGSIVREVAAFDVDVDVATQAARQLAPLDDADLRSSAATSLPGVVPIADLLGLTDIDAGAILERWSPGRRPPRARMIAGVSDRGPLTLDLDDDGPHGLVAGTTGAGKSELLRSLIIGLAVDMQPDEINFVLVDFKGGSAFDVCAELPHTVGMVTDLDAHLAGRVLRCLRAELHHRELVLRDAGATDLKEYQALEGRAPLPRLVLVVDEFASVAAELPEFLPSLVDIAQRGRSLGIHMILATQRPAGVVDNKIKANTNLRIALRVQDDGDSMDVIGTKDAASLPRSAPGRAYARFSAGELTVFQSAYSTGNSAGGSGPGAEIAPWVVARPMTPPEAALARRLQAPAVETDSSDAVDTDLARLVRAISDASTSLGQNDQRHPAPPPLPAQLDLDELPAPTPGDAVPVGLADLPDEQRRAVVEWSPGDSRLVFGIAGSGTSSLLVTIAVGIAARYRADDVHLIAIDADTNTLAPLAELPHCGSLVRSDESERLQRLARELSEEVARRAALAADLGGPARVAELEPTIVVLIDNIGALRQTLDDDRALDGVWQSIERAIRDGQALGVCAVITAKQERAVPTSLAAQIPDRLVMRLGDQYAYAGFGFRPAELPDFVPGRALRVDDKVEVQLVAPPASIADHLARLDPEPASLRPPLRVDPLPSSVLAGDVVSASIASATELGLAVGLDKTTARPALATVPFGEALFVTGPARSGRSGVLATLAMSAKHADPTVTVFAVAPRGGPLSTCAGVDDAAGSPGDVPEWVERVADHGGRRLVLVDDADRIGGPSFERLAGLADDDLVIVVAGRADSMRAVSHWTRPLQRFRHGVLLRPTLVDGELIRTQLGPRLPRFDAGHGVLVCDGEIAPLLAAHVESPESAQDEP